MAKVELSTKEEPMSSPRFLSFVALAFVTVTSSAQAQQTGTVLREAEDDDMMVQQEATSAPSTAEPLARVPG
jgi:hypothetical protein